MRTILNFGHTIGHAFETATDYRRFKHGEAVAWGMIAALEYGKELGMMDSGEADRLAQLVHRTAAFLAAGNLITRSVECSCPR